MRLTWTPPAFPMLRSLGTDEAIDIHAIAVVLEAYRALIAASLTIPFFWGVSNLLVGPGQTFYLSPAQGGASEGLVQTPSPRRLLLADFRVWVTPPPGAGESYAFTLRINGADTDVTFTVSGGGQSAQDLTHEALIEEGDLLDIKVVTSAAAAALTNVRLSFNGGLHVI